MTGYLHGDLIDPQAPDEVVRTAELCIKAAETLGVPRLNLHTAELVDGKAARPRHRATGEMWMTALRTLERIGDLGAAAGVTFCVENLNTIVDHPGVPLARAKDTLALVEGVGHPNVKMMLDLYHAQIGEGNLIELVRRCGDAIGEIQVADVPGRCEPGTGEINYPAIAKALRDIGFAGTVGMEAWASGDSTDSPGSVPTRVQLIARADAKLARDSPRKVRFCVCSREEVSGRRGGVEVVARRAVAVAAELDRVPESSNAVRAIVSSGAPAFSSSSRASDARGAACADALTRQTDVHAARPQRLVQPVALQLVRLPARSRRADG